MAASLSEQILEVLQRRRPSAALVQEIAVLLLPRPAPDQLDAALQELGRQRSVLTVDHPAPDIHLEGTDLRIVARIPDGENEAVAAEAADLLWNSWLRAFFSTHRCQ